jgi:hypothetical protein
LYVIDSQLIWHVSFEVSDLRFGEQFRRAFLPGGFDLDQMIVSICWFLLWHISKNLCLGDALAQE